MLPYRKLQQKLRQGNTERLACETIFVLIKMIMMSDRTDIMNFSAPDWRRLAPALGAAEAAVGRADERLRGTPLAVGVIARLDVAEAVAALWLQGELIDADDLILHDRRMDARRADLPLLAAHQALIARRRLGRLPAGVPDAEATLRAIGDTGAVRDRAADWDWRAAAAAPDRAGERASLTAWLEATRRLFEGPPTLATALAWRAWDRAPPLPRQPWLGALLVAQALRKSRCPAGAPALALGLRRRRLAHGIAGQDPLAGVLERIDALRAAAEEALAVAQRLELAAEVLTQRARDCRAHSRLPALIELVLEEPLVTSALVAKRLEVSAQAAQTLIARAGPSLRETTGRGRYRAWRLA
jgi:hypothetical protein